MFISAAVGVTVVPAMSHAPSIDRVAPESILRVTPVVTESDASLRKNWLESILSRRFALEAVPSTVAFIVPSTVRLPDLSSVSMLTPSPFWTTAAPNCPDTATRTADRSRPAESTWAYRGRASPIWAGWPARTCGCSSVSATQNCSRSGSSRRSGRSSGGLPAGRVRRIVLKEIRTCAQRRVSSS